MATWEVTATKVVETKYKIVVEVEAATAKEAREIGLQRVRSISPEADSNEGVSVEFIGGESNSRVDNVELMEDE